MIYAFDDFELDMRMAELRRQGAPVPMEPRVFRLLCLLVQNTDRVITRDEMIEQIWSGRIISEAALSTAIHSLRRALGDDGAAPRYVRTIRGQGFRFVAPVSAEAHVAEAMRSPEDSGQMAPVGTRQASIAVLRFQLPGAEKPRPELSDGIPAELISSLSKLHWLHVIARGSSFRFNPDNMVPGDVAKQLDVRYLLTGSVEPTDRMLTLAIELLSTSDGAVVWSERFTVPMAELQVARRDIVASVISALEIHVPRFESEHARHLSAHQLDAWSHYHLGLRHMYRYNEVDNAIAAGHFASAIELDTEFARAHAGLSFTYWQNAFMHFDDDRKQLLDKAVGSASRALQIDPQDPFASFNMGRALWLEGDVYGGITWLDRALIVNPNYAQCYYTMGLTRLLSGSADLAQGATDKAIHLSPLDPLLYAMLSTKALSHIANEDFAAAGMLAEKAVHVPGAHFYIAMITAIALELGGNRAAAETWRDKALAERPDFSVAMFFKAFPFKDPSMQSRIARALTRLGIL